MPEGENAVEHKKIILFGGTFDPPHNGHMTLLSGAIETVQPDLVIVEPAGTPPHKRAGETAARHRAAVSSMGGGVCTASIVVLLFCQSPKRKRFQPGFLPPALPRGGTRSSGTLRS